MNKKELDVWIKKNKKTRSMYAPHIDEIRYLLENNVSLDSINNFIFEQYGYSGSKPTLHTFIKRHIKKEDNSLNSENTMQKKEVSSSQTEIKKDVDSKKTNGKRRTVETSKRQMPKT